MTLAVNLGVMTRGALRGAVSTWTATRQPAARAGWPAPAIDPRLLIAIVLIFAELMLVTALALFFSTFSSPLLATLLTLGLWVAGHFNADLRHFEKVVDSRRSPLARARRSTTCCRTSRRSTSRPKSCTACRCRRARRASRWPTRWSTSRMLLTAAVAIFRRRDFK